MAGRRITDTASLPPRNDGKRGCVAHAITYDKSGERHRLGSVECWQRRARRWTPGLLSAVLTAGCPRPSISARRFTYGDFIHAGLEGGPEVGREL